MTHCRRTSFRVAKGRSYVLRGAIYLWALVGLSVLGVGFSLVLPTSGVIGETSGTEAGGGVEARADWEQRVRLHHSDKRMVGHAAFCSPAAQLSVDDAAPRSSASRHLSRLIGAGIRFRC